MQIDYFSPLSKLVRLTENNRDCAVFQVLPYKSADLVRLGAFTGSELQFRVFKCPYEGANSVDVTIWSQGSAVENHFTVPVSAYWGQTRLASDYYDSYMDYRKLSMILDTVCVDYGISVTDLDAISKSEDFRTPGDKFNKPITIEYNYESQYSGASLYWWNIVRCWYNGRVIVDLKDSHKANLAAELRNHPIFRPYNDAVRQQFDARNHNCNDAPADKSKKFSIHIKPEELCGSSMLEWDLPSYAGVGVDGNFVIKVSKNLLGASYEVEFIDQQSGDVFQELKIPAEDLGSKHIGEATTVSIRAMITGRDTINGERF